MKKLAYYVYVENINKRKIEPYNVLNKGILEQIKKRCKECDVIKKEQFAGHVEAILMCYYWEKTEWEIIITDCLTHIKIDELDRLNEEIKEYSKGYNKDPYYISVNLSVEKEVDVYDQIMLNWNIFIDYLWNNWGKDICKWKRGKDE